MVPTVPADLHAEERELFDAALQVLRDRGARLVDVRELPATDEFDVLHYEFARDLDAYLSRLPDGAPMRSLAEIVAWNEAHADVALKYGQARLLAAVAIDHDAGRRAYEALRARDLSWPRSTVSTRCWAPMTRKRSSCRRGGPRESARGPAIPASSCRPAIAARADGRSGSPSSVPRAPKRRCSRWPMTTNKRLCCVVR